MITIVVSGPRGSGKTTIAALLAQQLGVLFPPQDITLVERIDGRERSHDFKIGHIDRNRVDCRRAIKVVDDADSGETTEATP